MKILSGLVLLLCIGGSFSHEGHSHGAPGGGAAGIPGTVTLPPIDSCTCWRSGNYYSVRGADKCGSFTQRTAFGHATTQNCPAGLQFDLQKCVCNYPKDTYCPGHCSATQQAQVQAPATTGRTCSVFGNNYSVKPGTNCRGFTQATATLPPQVHHCPTGLIFSIDICVCNWPARTKCYQH